MAAAASMSQKRFRFVILASAGLCGCDYVGHMVLVNNTGRDAKVVVEHIEPEEPVAFSLRKGEVSKGFFAPGEVDWMRITVQGCEYSYHTPRFGLNYPFEPYEYTYPVMTQIEPDFTIYLLPSGAGAAAPVETLAKVQQCGFPVRPLATTCQKQSGRGSQSP